MLRAEGGDDGLQVLRIHAPDGGNLAILRSYGPMNQGIREFVLESPEPEGLAILDSYPEGDYELIGLTLDGERLLGSATLSHALPAAPVILQPLQDAVVAGDELTIQWSAVPDAAMYILEFENESADPEQSMLLNLPAGTTSFELPSSLLVPGAGYQVGVAAVGENGNLVFSETTFTTAP